MSNFNKGDLVYVKYKSMVTRYIGPVPQSNQYKPRDIHRLEVLINAQGRKPATDTYIEYDEVWLLPLEEKHLVKINKRLLTEENKLAQTRRNFQKVLANFRNP